MAIQSKRRVLLIGLDGATWRLLEPMMAKGWLPNLAHLCEQTASGVLESTVPPVTAPAWASFQTGLLPGKHGVYDFNQYERGQYRTQFASSADITQPTIWQLASNVGKRVVSVNVPLTYPLCAVNGVAVGGMQTPNLHSEFIYPSHLRERFLQANPNYRIIVPQTEFNLHGLEYFIEESIAAEQARVGAFRYLLSEVVPDWHLAMVHIQSTDTMQHAVYCWLDPTDERFSQDKCRKIARFYQAMDEEVGRLVADLGNERTLVVILSDHGHGSIYKMVNMNAYLSQVGLLQFHGQGQEISLSTWLRRAVKWLLRLDRWNLNKALLPKRIRRPLLERLAHGRVVDWSRTQVYMTNGWVYAYLYLNLKNREAEGIVDPADYDKVCTQATEAVLRLTDPTTGGPIIERVLRREEAFEGPYLDLAPDLIVVPKPGYEFSTSVFQDTDSVVRENRLGRDHTGSHTMDGILILSGPGVMQSRLEGARLVDLFPTVLAWLDVPVPGYSDGRVLAEAFAEPISVQVGEETLEPGGAFGPGEQAYSEEEAREIEERLKALGYM
jgi:predicted AlkP superfamily phosphohydrolase/phosphomutase